MQRTNFFIFISIATLTYTVFAKDDHANADDGKTPEEVCEVICGMPPWNKQDKKGVTPSMTCQEICGNVGTAGEKRTKRDTSTAKMDIIFGVDASTQIDDNHFAMAKAFIIQFAELLPVGPDDVQIGLVKYAAKLYIEFPPSTYINRKQTQEAAVGLNRMGITADKTSTDIAIESIVDMFEKEGRKGAERICILFTVGNSEDPTKTASAAEKARSQGIKLFAVELGYADEAGQAEIKAIGNTKTVEYTMASLTDLLHGIHAKSTSSVESDTHSKVDLIFLVDTDINAIDLGLGTTFVSNVVGQLNVNDEYVRVGLFTFDKESSSAKELIRLTDSQSREKVQSEVNAIKPNDKGKTKSKDFSNVIRQVVSNFKNNGRTRVSYVFALITDGIIGPTDNAQRRQEALDAIKAGEADPLRVFPYTISIGRAVDQETLVQLARAPNRHLKVSDVTKFAQSCDALGQTL